MEDPRIGIKKRFIAVMEDLISRKVKGASNKFEFAETMKLSSQLLYNTLANDSRYITIQMIFYMIKTFDVNSNYIFLGGDLPIFNSSKKSSSSAIVKLQKIQEILNK